jgi:hypothetical protein
MANTPQYKPFSDKYKDYFNKTLICRYNCLEGAYRASKTICNCFAWVAYLQRTREKLHIIASQTIGLAKLTIIDGNGYGLLNILGSRARIGKYEGNEALFVNTDNGEKICIICSHGKADSYRQIQGMSIGGIFAGELGLAYTDKEDETKDWVSVALSRLTASKDPFFISDMNPVSPSAYIYTHLDRMSKSVREDGESDWNYKSVSLFDNNALTDQQKQAYASLFDPNSIEYKRNILGKREAAEGIIYTYFNNNKEKCKVDEKDEYTFLKGHKGFVSIGIDYSLGGSSNTAFVASWILDDFRMIYVFADELLDTKDKTPQWVVDKFKEFLIKVQKRSNNAVRLIFADYAQKILTNSVRQSTRQIAPNVQVLDCVKDKINNRIELKNSLMCQGKYFICSSASNVLDATESAIWDNKHPDTRLDNGTYSVDTLDAEEYSWSKYIKKLMIMSNK